MERVENLPKDLYPKGKKVIVTLHNMFSPTKSRNILYYNVNSSLKEISAKFRTKYRKARWKDFDGKTVVVMGYNILCVQGRKTFSSYRVKLLTDTNNTYFCCYPAFLKRK